MIMFFIFVVFFFSLLLILSIAIIVDFFNWSHAQNRIVSPVSPSWNIFKKLLYKNENR